MIKISGILLTIFSITVLHENCLAQTRWENVDAEFGALPPSIHVYRTTDPLEGKPNIAYYVEADLHDKNLSFETDTTLGRRLTPYQFFRKHADSTGGQKEEAGATPPLVVVNATFFSFATNQNLNLVMKNGRLASFNVHSLPLKGKDTLTYRHPLGSAIGISRDRKADVAWLFTDSSMRVPLAVQTPLHVFRDSSSSINLKAMKRKLKQTGQHMGKWNMQAAVGGGPVLLQDGEVRITNNEEFKFPGKAIDDRHPRTVMGYTNDGKLIILVVEGRNPGKAEGASLRHLAELMKGIGCQEALNLDGGGSSCLLVNGKNTIRPSDGNAQQRPVPAVFMIRKK